MKTKTIFITLIYIFIIISFIIQSCKKDEEKNQSPNCEIISPTNGQEIIRGATVIISVEANDSDGNIAEVRFAIDGVGKDSVSGYPYNYNWITNIENIGLHSIKTTCIDNDGGSTSDEITVTIIENSGNVPVANFTADITSGTAPLTVNFVDQSTNTATTWQWNFGDGGTSTQPNPAHTYNTGGSYTVTLTVSNVYGFDTKIETSFIIVNTSGGSTPVADFSADVTIGIAPLTVNFSDQSTNTPTTWQWEFGDGVTRTEQSPSHTYNTDGSYMVTLTVSNEYGNDTKIKINYIYVGSGGGGEPCPGTPTVIDADGNIYNTVQIGGQCWMKENLRVGVRIDVSQDMTSGNGIEKYCYNDDPANCETYGGLYQWNEMMQYITTQRTQGICPSGWHLPTDDEWKTMEMALGMSQSQANAAGWRGTDEGEKMKSTSGWNNNGNGTNSSGFIALPGGYRTSTGLFYSLGDYGYWWSRTEDSGTYVWYRYLGYNNDQVLRSNNYKTNGFSARCLQN